MTRCWNCNRIVAFIISQVTGHKYCIAARAGVASCQERKRGGEPPTLEEMMATEAELTKLAEIRLFGKETNNEL